MKVYQIPPREVFIVGPGLILTPPLSPVEPETQTQRGQENFTGSHTGNGGAGLGTQAVGP